MPKYIVAQSNSQVYVGNKLQQKDLKWLDNNWSKSAPLLLDDKEIGENFQTTGNQWPCKVSEIRKKKKIIIIKRKRKARNG